MSQNLAVLQEFTTYEIRRIFNYYYRQNFGIRRKKDQEPMHLYSVIYYNVHMRKPIEKLRETFRRTSSRIDFKGPIYV